MTVLLDFRLTYFIRHWKTCIRKISFAACLLFADPCFSAQSSMFEQHILPFGHPLSESEKQLTAHCEDVKQTMLFPGHTKNLKTQLSCNNYQYLGLLHRLSLTFINDRLEQIEIFDMRSLLPEVKVALTAVYGEPKVSASYIDYFDNAGISLDVLSEKLTFISPRLKSEFKQQLKSAQNYETKLSLSREKWLQDLTQLDSLIREKHINPFFHQSEKGYLELFVKAQEYITLSEVVDTYIVNGYFEQLVAYTGDGHSYVSGRIARYGELPFHLEWFGDNLHITIIDEVNGDLLAAKVIAIGRHDVDKVMHRMKAFTASVNTSSFKRESVWLMRHPGLLFAAGISDSANEVALTLQLTNGKHVYRRIKKLLGNATKPRYLVQRELKTVEKPRYRLKKPNNQWFEYLSAQNILYFRYSLVAEKEKGNFRKVAQSLKAALNSLKPGKLIIDIRNNPGGNSYLNAPLINVIRNNQLINQRGKLLILTRVA